MSLKDDFSRRGITFATCANTFHIQADPALQKHLRNFGMIYPEVEAFLSRYLNNPQAVTDLALYAKGAGMKFAVMPGMAWNHGEAWPVEFGSMTQSAILETMRGVFMDLAALHPEFIVVANEQVLPDGSERPGPWQQMLGPKFLELLFQTARNAAPGIPLAYNDYVLTEPHAARVVKLRKWGLSIVLTQGHSYQNGILWSNRTPNNIDGILRAWKSARLAIGFGEVDVERSTFEACPAVSSWGDLVRCARRNKMLWFGLWGAADHLNWKAPNPATPWGRQDGDKYAEKMLISGAMAAGLGVS